MHVTQLLRGGPSTSLGISAAGSDARYAPQLALAPDIEVVETRLPELVRRLPKLLLVGSAPPLPLAQHAPGESQLQRQHDGRGRAALRFADEQIKVFGHDYVSQNYDSVAAPHGFEHGKENVAVTDGGEERLPLETTTGNKMKIAGAVVAMKQPRHE